MHPGREPDRCPQCMNCLQQSGVAGTLQQVTGDARCQPQPRAAPFAFDVEPVAHKVEPAPARPGEATLLADLVADHDIAAIADTPIERDGAQAEIELFPTKE